MRVVSLLPSATEIVALLLDGPGGVGGGGGGGSRPELVGRSHECDAPREPWLERLPVLTAARTHGDDPADIDRQVREALAEHRALYTLDEDRLRDLKPDVIITQDLCAVCSIDLASVRRVAAGLASTPRVISLNPLSIEGVLDDVLLVGEALGLAARAREVVVGLRQRLYAAQEYVSPYAARPNVAFLEWTDPLFIGGHWTPQLIERAGGEHPLNPTQATAGAGAAEGPAGQTLRVAGKSVRVPPEILAATRPDVLIVSPCGVPLEQAIAQTERLAASAWWAGLPAVQAGRVAVVDGNQMFNRPGPRLVDAFEFLVGYLNDRPEVIPPGFPWRRL